MLGNRKETTQIQSKLNYSYIMLDNIFLDFLLIEQYTYSLYLDIYQLLSDMIYYIYLVNSMQIEVT